MPEHGPHHPTETLCLGELLGATLLVRFPEQWVRYVTARGALSFLSLALEWLDAPPHIRRAIRQEAKSG